MSEEITKMFVVVGANIDEFKRGMGEINTVASGTAAKLESIGGAGEMDKLKDSTAAAGEEAKKAGGAYGMMGKMLTVAAITGGVMAFKKLMMNAAEYGVEISNAAKQTGLTTGLIQELRFGADLTGTSFANLTTATGILNKKLKDAADGKKGAVKVFEDIGLSVDELMKMKPDERLMAIFDAIAKIEDPGLKAAAAIGILGESGDNLLPLVENMGKVQETADKMNIKMTQEQIDSLVEGAKATALLSEQWRILSNKFAATVWPGVTPFIQALQGVVDLLGKVSDAWNTLPAPLRMVLSANLIEKIGILGNIIEKIKEGPQETIEPLGRGNEVIQLYIDGEQVTNVVERRMYRNTYDSRGYV